jgi:hypothetical protein
MVQVRLFSLTSFPIKKQKKVNLIVADEHEAKMLKIDLYVFLSNQQQRKP